LRDQTENPEGSSKTEPEPESEKLPSDGRRSEEYLMRLKDLQADFENYRKRAEKEMQEVEEASARDVAMKLLSVQDELELAIGHVHTGKEPELEEGVKMVYKKLTGVLESLGLKRIVCVGRPFDPEYHEAVEKVQGGGSKDMVIDEVRSGFTFRGRVIRPSMVKVELAMNSQGEQEEKQVE